MMPNGKMLTRFMFCLALDKILQELKLNLQHFNRQNFRIGAATSAKHAGISDAHLKALGRWKSHAYPIYIRPSRQDLANLSKSLILKPDEAEHAKL